MPKYQVEMIYPDGTRDLQDEIFDTEEDAEDYGCELIGAYREGSEVMFYSNPGDYPMTDEDPSYEIYEIDD